MLPMAALVWSKPLTILRLPFLLSLVTSTLGGSRLHPPPSFLPLPFSNPAVMPEFPRSR